MRAGSFHVFGPTAGTSGAGCFIPSMIPHGVDVVGGFPTGFLLRSVRHAETTSGRGSTLLTMTPIPSDPLKRPPAEVTLGDGRKVKLKIPGLDPAAEPSGSAERDPADPPSDEPRLPTDPNAASG